MDLVPTAKRSRRNRSSPRRHYTVDPCFGTSSTASVFAPPFAGKSLLVGSESRIPVVHCCSSEADYPINFAANWSADIPSGCSSPQQFPSGASARDRVVLARSRGMAISRGPTFLVRRSPCDRRSYEDISRTVSSFLHAQEGVACGLRPCAWDGWCRRPFGLLFRCGCLPDLCPRGLASGPEAGKD